MIEKTPLALMTCTLVGNMPVCAYTSSFAIYILVIASIICVDMHELYQRQIGLKPKYHNFTLAQIQRLPSMSCTHLSEYFEVN